MTRKASVHGNLDECDKIAVDYARKYRETEREIAIRAFRKGWSCFFLGISPQKAWDEATRYAEGLQEYDFHITRIDFLAGYNKADEFRRR